jgi:hypothetical protein
VRGVRQGRSLRAERCTVYGPPRSSTLTRSQLPRALRPSPQNPPGCGEVAGGAGMPRCSRRNGRATALRVVARLAWVFMYEVGTALARPSATCIYEPTGRANNPPPSPF